MSEAQEAQQQDVTGVRLGASDLPVSALKDTKLSRQLAADLQRVGTQPYTSNDDSRRLRQWARAAGIRVTRTDHDELVVAFDAFMATVMQDGSPLPSTEFQDALPLPPITQSTTLPALTGPTDKSNVNQAVQTLVEALTQGPQPATVDDEHIIALIKRHAPARPNIIEVKPLAGGERKKLGLQHTLFKKLLKFAEQRENVYLCGPAGSGKTTAARSAAEALELPFYSHGALGSSHTMLGYCDANGTYHRTTFRDAFENGGVFLWDEVDGSIPGEAICLNDAIACDVDAPVSFPDGMVKRHKDFVVIAAANTIGNGASREYVGRYQLDGATLDRFAFMEWTYDKKLERHACGNEDWADYVQAFRSAVDKCKIRHIVSPRASIKGARMLAAGMGRADVLESFLYKGLSRDDLQRIQREVAK